MAKPAPVLNQASVLAPDEARVVAGLTVARPRTWWMRFIRALQSAAKVVTREEFEVACVAAVKACDGLPLDPVDAALKARRIVEAHTGALAQALVQKCDVSDVAVMTIFLGEPRAAFFFSRALKLTKGSRRG